MSPRLTSLYPVASNKINAFHDRDPIDQTLKTSRTQTVLSCDSQEPFGFALREFAHHLISQVKACLTSHHERSKTMPTERRLTDLDVDPDLVPSFEISASFFNLFPTRLPEDGLCLFSPRKSLTLFQHIQIHVVAHVTLGRVLHRLVVPRRVASFAQRVIDHPTPRLTCPHICIKFL
ncbi:hypothetical protein SAMN05444000_1188 [Shimia gijangensis]|uniref:Uncharacterized protein n=1 Tax=Shimia gijangensis TaxID=1470563 RepID=A0A1M6PD95_9RHOB|nr:hypothetical protein SAMN05444000_1188 [Shimia gijangensis]